MVGAKQTGRHLFFHSRVSLAYYKRDAFSSRFPNEKHRTAVCGAPKQHSKFGNLEIWKELGAEKFGRVASKFLERFPNSKFGNLEIWKEKGLRLKHPLKAGREQKKRLGRCITAPFPTTSLFFRLHDEIANMPPSYFALFLRRLSLEKAIVRDSEEFAAHLGR